MFEENFIDLANKQFKNSIEKIEENLQYKCPIAFALGIRRRHQGITLDVHFPQINFENNFSTAALISAESNFPQENSYVELNTKNLDNLWQAFTPFHNDLDNHSNIKIINQLRKISDKSGSSYHQTDVIAYFLFDKDSLVESVEEGYFKLNCLSQRCVLPHGVCLAGIFGKLTNVAWSNKGPILPEHLNKFKTQALIDGEEFLVSHIDKFPYLINYLAPTGVRIASGSKVRLGAYLGEGTTVMPAGYVNFNAGTEGNTMVEGRISAGVFVKKGSDIGGGASIMGTLSGGNKNIITIDEKCLIGANGGTGISLGKGCTIAAGLYIYGGMKVSLYDEKDQPIDLSGSFVKDGDNIVKANNISGRDYLLFIQDSQTGKIICKPNKKLIDLNDHLHKN